MKVYICLTGLLLIIAGALYYLGAISMREE